MKFNLKKVISSVAALTLAASSFTAFAAADYTDVPSTATYSKAVNELSALKVIAGYEDGSFQPDKNVTRAEITKMIIATLGDTMVNSANSATGSATKFTDVPASHWASGWVSVATDQASFITGYGDGTFGPEDNVTYMQAIKMIVAALGYTTWSESNGGWPSGYLSYGNQLGITTGLSGIGQDTQVTRAQVAQMIDNALDAPLCLITSWETNDYTGEQKPVLEKKDGEGKDWQTLLTHNLDTYRVNGRVSKTNASSSGTVKVGECNFDVEYAKNFDDTYYSKADTKAYGAYTETGVKVGDSKADDYLFTYADALLQKDDNDEYTILSLVPAGKNETVEFTSGNIDDENSKYTANTTGQSILDAKALYVLQSSTSSKTSTYKLNDNAKLYVNGVEVDYTASDLQDYLVDNETGTVTLIDSPDAGYSTVDGYYDYIMVSYYATGIVDSTTINSSTAKVYFLESYDPVKSNPSNMTIDLEDDDITYTATKNGETVALKDLAEYDVLSVAYDVTGSFADSNFYNILVSDTKVEGKMTGYSNDDDDLYTVGGTEYQPVEPTGTGSAVLENGVEYVLYMDAFGRFIYPEELASSKNIAILENVYVSTSGDDYKAVIIPKNGVKTEVTVKDKNYAAYRAMVYGKDGNTDVKYDIQDRVITYSLNTSGELTVKDQLNANVATDAEYKLSTNKIGTVKLSDDTAMLNIGDYEDDKSVSTTSISTLVDGDDYTVYGYDKSSSDSTYRFVLIDSGAGNYTVNTNVAVYNSQKIVDTDDGSDVTALYVYTSGSENAQQVLVDTGIDSNYQTVIDNLKKGDPIIYATDGSGYVTKLDTLFTSALTGKLADGYSSFENVVNSSSDFSSLIFKPTAWTNSVTAHKNNYADLKFGPVYDKTTNGITLAEINDTYNGKNVTNTDKLDEISFDSDVKVYVYDYNNRSDYRLSMGTKASIAKTNISKSNYEDSDNTMIDWTNADIQDNINYALVKTNEDDATEIYIIIHKD